VEFRFPLALREILLFLGFFFFLFLFVCMVVSLIFGIGGCWFGGREEEAAGGGEQDEAENEDRFAVGDFGEDLCRFMFFLFNNLFYYF